MEIRYKDFAQNATEGEVIFAGYSYSTLDEVIAECQLAEHRRLLITELVEQLAAERKS